MTQQSVVFDLETQDPDFSVLLAEGKYPAAWVHLIRRKHRETTARDRIINALLAAELEIRRGVTQSVIDGLRRAARESGNDPDLQPWIGLQLAVAHLQRAEPGDIPKAITWAERGLRAHSRLSQGKEKVWAMLIWALGRALIWQGQLSEAEKNLAVAYPKARSLGSSTFVITGDAELVIGINIERALATAKRGAFNQARSLLREAERFCRTDAHVAQLNIARVQVELETDDPASMEVIDDHLALLESDRYKAFFSQSLQRAVLLQLLKVHYWLIRGQRESVCQELESMLAHGETWIHDYGLVFMAQ